MRNKLWVLPWLLMIFSCNTMGDGGSNQGSLTLEVDQRIRNYRLYIPSEPTEDMPMLFVLHGYSSNNMDMINYVNMNRLAEEYGFIVCYPQGVKDGDGNPHWNAGLTLSRVDDVQFLSELALALQDEYPIDSRRIWTTGFSNGGFMSYELVCQRPDIFKGAASIGGVMSFRTWQNRPVSGREIPVLQIHGMLDEVVPLDGTMGPWGGFGGAPDLDTIMEYWADYNQCTRFEEISLSSNAKLRRFYTPQGHAPVEYIMVENLGHQWPGAQSDTSGINASEYLVDFFFNL